MRSRKQNRVRGCDAEEGRGGEPAGAEADLRCRLRLRQQAAFRRLQATLPGWRPRPRFRRFAQRVRHQNRPVPHDAAPTLGGVCFGGGRGRFGAGPELGGGAGGRKPPLPARQGPGRPVGPVAELADTGDGAHLLPGRGADRPGFRGEREADCGGLGLHEQRGGLARHERVGAAEELEGFAGLQGCGRLEGGEQGSFR